MKKNRKQSMFSRMSRRSIFFFVLLALFISTGCQNQFREVHADQQEMGVKTMTFTLKLKGESDMRAIGRYLRANETEDGDYDTNIYGESPLNEYKVESSTLFFVNQENNKFIKINAGKIDFTNTSSSTPNQKQHTVNLSEDEYLALNNNIFDIYFVANPPEELNSVENFTDLQKLMFETAFSKAGKQNSFVMDGVIKGVEPVWNDGETNYTVNDSKILQLKRAAAKVRLRVKDIDINGYTVATEGDGGAGGVKVYNINEKGYVLTPESFSVTENSNPTQYKNSQNIGDVSGQEYIPIKDITQVNQPTELPQNGEEIAKTKWVNSLPIYTYQNDWSTASPQGKETYLVLKLMLKREEDTDFKPYFYKLPLYHTEEAASQHLNKVERNYLYDVAVTINRIGSTDEFDPVEITSNIAVEPWKIVDIQSDIGMSYRLLVMEEDVLMANTTTREIEYLTSHDVYIVKQPVTSDEEPIEDGDDIVVYYDTFKSNNDFYRIEVRGKKKREYSIPKLNVEYNPTDWERPDGTQLEDTQELYAGININRVLHKEGDISKGKIEIKSQIIKDNPIYSPVHIMFTIKHKKTAYEKSGLKERIHITQFPPKYITAIKSTGKMNSVQGSNEVVTGTGTNLDDYTSIGVKADFRYHTTFGTKATNPFAEQGEEKTRAQDVSTMFRVTTVVPEGDEMIGDPTEVVTITNDLGNQVQIKRTKEDPTSNKIISPEFIVASHFGMPVNLPRYKKNGQKIGWGPFVVAVSPFTTGTYNNSTVIYGPHNGNPFFASTNNPEPEDPANTYSKSYVTSGYYNSNNELRFYYTNGIEDTKDSNTNIGDYYGMKTYFNYKDAEDFCANYFEGEYGRDDIYEEVYFNNYIYNTTQGYVKIPSTRKVKKVFKYKGNWRIPTLAELKFIENIQKSSPKNYNKILWGSYYWAAEKQSQEKGVALRFTAPGVQSEVVNPPLIESFNNGKGIFVRCVFDTYDQDDKDNE